MVSAGAGGPVSVVYIVRDRAEKASGFHRAGLVAREVPMADGTLFMSRICQVTGKGALSGNNVSHANNKTRRRWLPNLHERRFWVPSENRWVSLRVSSHGLRTIDKKGIEVVIAELRKRGEKV